MTFVTPTSYTTNEAMSAAKLNTDLYNNVLWLYAQHPQRATLFHLESTVTNGNAITGTVDTAQRFMTYFNQDAAAQDDQFTQTVLLGPGLYQMKMIGQQFNGGGIFDVDIGGTSIGDGFDSYNVTVNRDVDLLGDTGLFEIVRSGVYTITVTVYSKHASSSGYALRLTTIEIMPQGSDL